MDLVSTLAVERAVQRAYLDYCDAIDEKRFDDLGRVFTPDCEGDYRDPQGVALNGLAPLVMRLRENVGPDSTWATDGVHVLIDTVHVDGVPDAGELLRPGESSSAS
ncbi:MAG: nuclear transport factor 2 family protein [Pseudonocardiales bacterium]|nr:nuclear transport factor 2 family protein [Pseudonocardiales bacterium]